jgi:predicted deacylase
VLLTAGIHGDEYEGPAAILQIISDLEHIPVRGTCTAIPVAHPAAWSAATRLSPDDGLNLARVFPGDPAGSPTQRLAAFLFSIAQTATHLIDLHSGGSDCIFTPLAGFYGDESLATATCFGLPVLWKLPPTPGVLSFELTRLGKVAIGCEYLGSGQLSHSGVEAYARGVRNCLALWGLIAEDPVSMPQPVTYHGDWTLASATGAFFAMVALDDDVEQGQPVAEVRDVRGRTLDSLAAPAAGRVLAHRSKGYINAGDWGVLIGTEP